MIVDILNFLESRRYLLFIALILLTLVTFALTLLPPEKLSDSGLFQYDKLGHALMFGSWTFLLGLIQLVSNRKPLPLFYIFIAGSLFGITIEILQEVLPVDRSMDPYDAIADITGCLIAVILLKSITSKLSANPKNREQ